MSRIQWIRACWQCDGCGKDFVVEIDSGWSPPKEWDLTDIAKDAVRHGEVVEMTKYSTTKHGLANSSSVQADLVLCSGCTHIADEIEGDPTKDEILRAICPSAVDAE